MSNEEQDKLLNHEYDGIQELDNNLPSWWLWTFFITIIFSFIYWLHYSFTGDGPTLGEELQAKMTKIEQQRNAVAAVPSEEAQDPAVLLAEGTKIYKNYCLSCHADLGQGSVGPNLTDDYWIHGKGEKAALQKVIEDGVLDKGMPPWKGILKPNEILAVLSFIDSIRGQNRPGKEPQGEKVTP